MVESVICGCSRKNDSLWSYCSDDYFCPQCGDKITRLISKHRLDPGSDEDEIWVYPKKGRDQEVLVYAFPIMVKHSDQRRVVQSRRPAIDFDQTTLNANPYFLAKMEPADPNPAEADRSNSPYRIRLIPRDNTVLPVEGVSLIVSRLVGDFSENEQLKLRIGNAPTLRVELSSQELEQDQAPGGGVRLTHDGELRVILKVLADNAPVRIKETLKNTSIHCKPELGESPPIAGPVSLQLDQELNEGEEVTPGKPWTTTATLFASALTIIGQRITIDLTCDILAATIDSLFIKLVRVEKGGVAFDPSGLFEIPLMYLGEARSNASGDKKENPEDHRLATYQPVIRRMSIQNLGRERMVLDKPTVLNNHPSIEWLMVRWATDVPENFAVPLHGQLTLEPLEWGGIYLHVDLRKISAEQLPSNRSLTAVIQTSVRETDETFTIPLVVREVRDRIPCPTPLCIDFGNTSSFASVKYHPEFPFPRTADIVDVHDVRFPEVFPTSIFFKTIEEDPFQAECEIGDLALAEAEKFSGGPGEGALVSDLKRWIGESAHAKTVSDPNSRADSSQFRRYQVEDLIVLFLVRLIERAEQILRKYTIQEISVSHPSRFDAGRRATFFKLIDRVCKRLTENHPSVPLKRTQADVDEANAVAVGAVFEEVAIRELRKERLSQGRKDFILASFDLGGGSLDTALMRFEVTNPSSFRPQYRSQYLGIGGHSGFGGDNVTLAFWECLRDRIHQALEKNNLPAAALMSCVSNPLQKDIETQSFIRRNYQILWDVAEKVKLYQCRFGSIDPSQQNAEALAEREPLTSFIQTKLVNDLQLITRTTGRIQMDPVVAACLKTFVEQAGFLIPLEEVYDHQFHFSLSMKLLETASISIRQRIQEGLKELKDLANSHQGEIDIIVLAGAGCRLPLVVERIAAEFPTAKIVNNPTRTKYRVGHGLVRFLDAMPGGHQFACSSHYSAFAYEAGPLGMDDKVIAIPNCAPLDASEKWYTLQIPEQWTEGVETNATLDDVISRDGTKRVYIFRVEEDQSRRPQGWFDLSLPPTTASNEALEPLSDLQLKSPDATVEVRLIGSEVKMELRLSFPDGARYCWRLMLGD